MFSLLFQLLAKYVDCKPKSKLTDMAFLYVLYKSHFHIASPLLADFSLCYILSLRAWTHSAVVSRVKTYKQLWSWDTGTCAGTQPSDDHIRITSVHIHPIHSMYPAQLLLTKINLCSSWSKEIYKVFIYILPHYNKINMFVICPISLRSFSWVLYSVT